MFKLKKKAFIFLPFTFNIYLCEKKIDTNRQGFITQLWAN